MSKTRTVLVEVALERARQDKNLGEQNHDQSWWIVIEGEEFGEVCRALYEGDRSNLRQEWIQVAAVAVAAVESLDRETPPRPDKDV